MRKASFWTAWMASKWLWCIFQLPEISGLRPGIRGLPQRGQAGQVALLDELQRGPTAGGHMVDLVVGAEGGDVAGQDDAVAGLVEQLFARAYVVGFEEGVAHVVAHGLQEGEAHAAADDEAVTAIEQRGDDAELVADLGAAEDGD